MPTKSVKNPNYNKQAGYIRENFLRENTPKSSRLNHRSPLGQLKAENAANARKKQQAKAKPASAKAQYAKALYDVSKKMSGTGKKKRK